MGSDDRGNVAPELKLLGVWFDGKDCSTFNWNKRGTEIREAVEMSSVKKNNSNFVFRFQKEFI